MKPVTGFGPIGKIALLVTLLVPASGAAGAAAPARGAVRGWLAAPSGAPEAGPPAGVRVLSETGGEAFVEMPAEVVETLAARGFRFREAAGAWLLSVGPERFDVRDGQPPIEARWRAAKPGPGPRPYVVKFDAPPDDARLADLERLGIRPLQYLPAFGYLVLLPEGRERDLQERPHVEFDGEYHPAYKAAAEVRALADADGPHTLRLIYFDVPGWERSLQAAERFGARVAHRSEAATSQRVLLHHAILEEVPGRALPRLLADPVLYHAERWAPAQLEGERAAQIVAGNVTDGAPDADYYAWLAEIGADGSGVTVTVADTGLDTGNPATIHPDFAGRVDFATTLCASNEDFNGHGTNTASIAVGDPRAGSGGTGLLDSLGFHWGGGSAPGAWLHFQKALGGSGCPAYNSDAGTLALDASLAGTQVGSHSFTDGLGNGGSYNSQAQIWDAAVRDADPAGAAGDQPYAVYFSAGNSGPGSGTLTSPKAAKNIVTVGATDNYRPGECPGGGGCGNSAADIELVASFSSRGPTSDGRIKPDVVTPGHVVSGAASSAAGYSCTCDGGGGAGCCDSTGVDGTFSYSRYSGTSQAAPRAAGAAAVVYDWYQNRFGAFPSPAMAKAILINGAADVKTADAPNFNEGWGRVSLRTVLQAPEGVELHDQATVIGSTGDPAAYTSNLYVQDPNVPMEASLVWTDPPAAIGCNPCLVNNLDLLVTQGGTTWRGNNFSGGFSTTSPSADALNNVEGVALPAGALGCGATFQVKVRAQSLAGDGVPGNGDATDQDFALVVRNAAATPGPPILAAASPAASGGCDADGFLDRNETIDLALDLSNVGCGGASGVMAQLSVASAPAGASVSVSPPGAVAVGTVAAGATVPVSAWQVSLGGSPGGFCGEQVILQVALEDDQARTWQGSAALLLDADAFTPVEDLDTADADGSFSADADWSLRGCRTSSPATSWHMGQSDCTGIPRGQGLESSLVFAYPLGPGDRLDSLTFQHAFGGYDNASFQDTVSVEIDHDGNGTYDLLQTWTEGVDNPTTMTQAGPYDLSPFDAGRGPTVYVRFRFRSGANWVGPNQASGWDVDDIRFAYATIACDPDACPAGPSPVPAGSLTVDVAGPNLVVGWGSAAGATGYNLYGGSLDSFYSHAILTDPLLDGGDSCQEPTTTATLAIPPGNVYILVAADDGSLESDLGTDSSGATRPFASTPCNLH